MQIKYYDLKEFTTNQLQELFLSLNWDSGNYPEKLQIALKNSSTVYSAWDEGKLVGLMNCLDDGSMTAYFHYLLVRPEYQGHGIGQKLVELMLVKYHDYYRKVLIAYQTAVGFYEKCGFAIGEQMIPVQITTLKT